MKGKPPKLDVTAANFPALRSFQRGYWHEDMADEYGSAPEAAQQFYLDADPDERQAVATEWARFLSQTKGLSLEEINRLLTGPLGGAIRLTAPELDEILAVFAKGK